MREDKEVAEIISFMEANTAIEGELGHESLACDIKVWQFLASKIRKAKRDAVVEFENAIQSKYMAECANILGEKDGNNFDGATDFEKQRIIELEKLGIK